MANEAPEAKRIGIGRIRTFLDVSLPVIFGFGIFEWAD